MAEVGKKLGIPLTCADINVIHHVQSKNKDKPNVIVKSASRRAHGTVLQAAKKKKLDPTDWLSRCWSGLHE